MTAKDVAGHMPGRRHVFDGIARKQVADELRRSDLVQQVIGRGRVDFEGVTQAQLLRWDTRDLRETLVDELRGNHGMFRFERVVGRQIVILTCVDDDTGGSVDAAREKLVDQRASHIDIAKDNAVQRVVEHHIQAF